MRSKDSWILLFNAIYVTLFVIGSCCEYGCKFWKKWYDAKGYMHALPC